MASAIFLLGNNTAVSEPHDPIETHPPIEITEESLVHKTSTRMAVKPSGEWVEYRTTLYIWENPREISRRCCFESFGKKNKVMMSDEETLL